MTTSILRFCDIVFITKKVGAIMNEYVDNFLRLYSDKQEEVYQAFLEKKEWILNQFYVPGDFEIESKANNEEGFALLEAVLEDCLLFNPYKFVSNNEDVMAVFNSYLNLVVYKEMKKNKQPYFWIKYDFSLMDKESYNALAANIYPRLAEEELDIDGDFLKLTECLKLMMIGEEHEHIIIVSKSATKNNRVKAPKLLEFIVHKEAPVEVKETLKKLALLKNAIYKEADYE